LIFGSAKIRQKALPANFSLIIYPREISGYQLFPSVPASF